MDDLGRRTRLNMHIIPHDQQQWLGAFLRTLIFLIVLAEGSWLLTPDLHPELNRYRNQERRKAFADWARERTTETKALWN